MHAVSAAVREWPLYVGGTVLGYRDAAPTASGAARGAEEKPTRSAPTSAVGGTDGKGAPCLPGRSGRRDFRGSDM